MIKAKVIADSRNLFGNRITTLIVTMPRYILAEFNTHRMLSKNSASSRAIPFEKNLKSIEESPFIPIAWMKDHKGMQGTEYHSDVMSEVSKRKWLIARDWAVTYAQSLSLDDVTKQLCNRLLEPFMWHTVIVTGTEWENFFALRCPKYKTNEFTSVSHRSKKDYLKAFGEEELVEALKENPLFWYKINKGQADIHMMATAETIWDAMNESIPKELKEGEWHIPFGDDIDPEMLGTITGNNNFTSKDNLALSLTQGKIKIATAMCARVSYTVVGEENKDPNYENDIKLHNRLATSGHWSPFEHCAKAMSINESMQRGGLNPDWFPLSKSGWSGNFRGFIQYRKTFTNENITKNVK